ncbi:hypothetical protein C8Q78DRAFT_369628 [Trametes maxima]|nr:hypothetical protein C8Q78DRAFT_369628 [Trametes maxima]
MRIVYTSIHPSPPIHIPCSICKPSRFSALLCPPSLFLFFPFLSFVFCFLLPSVCASLRFKLFCPYTFSLPTFYLATAVRVRVSRARQPAARLAASLVRACVRAAALGPLADFGYLVWLTNERTGGRAPSPSSSSTSLPLCLLSSSRAASSGVFHPCSFPTPRPSRLTASPHSVHPHILHIQSQTHIRTHTRPRPRYRSRSSPADTPPPLRTPEPGTTVATSVFCDYGCGCGCGCAHRPGGRPIYRRVSSSVFLQKISPYTIRRCRCLRMRVRGRRVSLGVWCVCVNGWVV